MDSNSDDNNRKDLEDEADSTLPDVVADRIDEEAKRLSLKPEDNGRTWTTKAQDVLLQPDYEHYILNLRKRSGNLAMFWALTCKKFLAADGNGLDSQNFGTLIEDGELANKTEEEIVKFKTKVLARVSQLKLIQYDKRLTNFIC
jgi:hypothetical protein